VTVCCNTH